jgi:hypothetical protein
VLFASGNSVLAAQSASGALLLAFEEIAVPRIASGQSVIVPRGVVESAKNDSVSLESIRTWLACLVCLAGALEQQ